MVKQIPKKTLSQCFHKFVKIMRAKFHEWISDLQMQDELTNDTRTGLHPTLFPRRDKRTDSSLKGLAPAFDWGNANFQKVQIVKTALILVEPNRSEISTITRNSLI